MNRLPEMSMKKSRISGAKSMNQIVARLAKAMKKTE
ncbi:MAG: hypothetical protein ACD_2C00098G0002 [uncultured bacterium (gcode 4)]|uniref:Uncharacterized protein n=1 Tax=uncultured bacterium (gcode 4) TaxID=1234023 RepID=K2G3H5_9BACT|nr:MAG: hypothetical protein ACD_2C00098G0002 [uncultured bacterium (gcode 4)]